MKTLTKEQIEEYQQYFESLYKDPKIKRIEINDQHRGSNTYLHVCKVTRLAYKLAKRSNRKVDFKDLILGAMLHDYFLYNWRLDTKKLVLHGHKHPRIALENARKDFEINDKVANIIISHMWPLNFFIFHKSYEAFLIGVADKCVSTREALTSQKYKLKHREEELSIIFTLEDK